VAFAIWLIVSTMHGSRVMDPMPIENDGNRAAFHESVGSRADPPDSRGVRVWDRRAPVLLVDYHSGDPRDVPGPGTPLPDARVRGCTPGCGPGGHRPGSTVSSVRMGDAPPFETREAWITSSTPLPLASGTSLQSTMAQLTLYGFARSMSNDGSMAYAD
jgi:hypothetical protein